MNEENNCPSEGEIVLVKTTKNEVLDFYPSIYSEIENSFYLISNSKIKYSEKHDKRKMSIRLDKSPSIKNSEDIIWKSLTSHQEKNEEVNEEISNTSLVKKETLWVSFVDGGFGIHDEENEQKNAEINIEILENKNNFSLQSIETKYNYFEIFGNLNDASFMVDLNNDGNLQDLPTVNFIKKFRELGDGYLARIKDDIIFIYVNENNELLGVSLSTENVYSVTLDALLFNSLQEKILINVGQYLIERDKHKRSLT
jgi:hypothetical protein